MHYAIQLVCFSWQTTRCRCYTFKVLRKLYIACTSLSRWSVDRLLWGKKGHVWSMWSAAKKKTLTRKLGVLLHSTLSTLAGTSDCYYFNTTYNPDAAFLNPKAGAIYTTLTTTRTHQVSMLSFSCILQIDPHTICWTWRTSGIPTGWYLNRNETKQCPIRSFRNFRRSGPK